ncbi:hypothetical protein GCM10010353_18470 [Streptomyces chryseus]|nr:hypothetical protein GCM10010353_18470 [Streptomyces chryseus]
MPQPGLTDDVAGDVRLRVLARDLLQQQPEQYVVGVGVRVLPALGDRRRGESEAGEVLGVQAAEAVGLQDLAGVLDDAGEGREHVVGYPAGVVEQHAHGHLATALAGHQLGQVAPDRRVQPDASLVDLLEDGHGGEGLGDAADPVLEAGPHPAPGVHVGQPCGAVPLLGTVADGRERPVHAGPVDRREGVAQGRPVEAVAGRARRCGGRAGQGGRGAGRHRPGG